MSFWGKLFSVAAEEENEPVMVASVPNKILSAMYQDLLKSNNIPFLCKLGAGGIKRGLGGMSAANDNIYVNKGDYNKALEIYNMYINNQGFEISDSEENL